MNEKKKIYRQGKTINGSAFRFLIFCWLLIWQVHQLQVQLSDLQRRTDKVRVFRLQMLSKCVNSTIFKSATENIQILVKSSDRCISSMDTNPVLVHVDPQQILTCHWICLPRENGEMRQLLQKRKPHKRSNFNTVEDQT